MREVFWSDGQPTVEEAIFAVTWTIDHAIKVNPGGVNGPIRIAALERQKKGALMARILDDEEIDEHNQAVADAIEHLRGFRALQQGDSPDVPEVPRL